MSNATFELRPSSAHEDRTACPDGIVTEASDDLEVATRGLDDRTQGADVHVDSSLWGVSLASLFDQTRIGSPHRKRCYCASVEPANPDSAPPWRKSRSRLSRPLVRASYTITDDGVG